MLLTAVNKLSTNQQVNYNYNLLTLQIPYLDYTGPDSTMVYGIATGSRSPQVVEETEICSDP